MVLLESKPGALNTGDLAPDFSLKGTDDKEHKLSEMTEYAAYVIVFMCNHCPYVIPKMDELSHIQEEFPEIKVIGINPNDPIEYPEDDMEHMKYLVVQGTIRFLYLQDETQDVARAYGAVCTPDPFLFDKDKKLVYHGRIDDTHGTSDAPKEHSLRNAVKELLTDGKISLEVKNSMGCSIKWKN